VTVGLNALRRALSENSPVPLARLARPKSPIGADYPIWRLARAWTGQFGPDEAVLVRQAIRNAGNQMFLPSVPDPVKEAMSRVGVRIESSGHATTTPWRPQWLRNDRMNPADGVDFSVRQRLDDESVVGEQYLRKSFGYENWKSRALKEACWKAYDSPHGSNFLIALPTGSGKSLCFQFLARFSPGLTLVIVPTVALAIDQYRSAKSLPGIRTLEPRYFAADDRDFPAQQVAEAVRSGSTRLLFCSPESCVSGRLRAVIDELAEQERLDNVVIDEAHMVGTWGVFFRVDFQLLSAVWKQWHEKSGCRLKTIMLSATFTEECRVGLASLFPSDNSIEFVSQRLRPEPSYFAAQFETDAARDSAVLEGMWHLPRPAILYTTRVEDAVRWRDELRKRGFSRIECFTGETRSEERRRLLDRWRGDDIEVMVATSAFGLGVDKQDVRAIVHACLPEDLDRYYQEVGRAGRDGCSSVSLLLTTPADDLLAEGMGPTLLRPDTIQLRWEALWRTRQLVDGSSHVYRVNLRTKRDELVGTRTYEENVRWNKRLLLQLYRAGQIGLLDLRSEKVEEEKQEWATLELKFAPESPDIADLVGVVRQRELEIIERGLDRMRAGVRPGERLCVVLAKLYGKGTIRVCGGCAGCRAEERPPDGCPPLPMPASPFALPRRELVLRLPEISDLRTPHPLARWIRRAAQMKGIRRFATSDENVSKLGEICREAFGGDPAPYRVDGLGVNGRDWKMPFRIETHEKLVLVHSKAVHSAAFALSCGQLITHWMCEGCEPTDARGKQWLDYRGIRPYLDPEFWIAAGEALVH